MSHRQGRRASLTLSAPSESTVTEVHAGKGEPSEKPPQKPPQVCKCPGGSWSCRSSQSAPAAPQILSEGDSGLGGRSVGGTMQQKCSPWEWQASPPTHGFQPQHRTRSPLPCASLSTGAHLCVLLENIVYLRGGRWIWRGGGGSGGQLTSFHGAQTHLLLSFFNRKDVPTIFLLALFFSPLPNPDLEGAWPGSGHSCWDLCTRPRGLWAHSGVFAGSGDPKVQKTHESFTEGNGGF